uniref:4-hydroxy-3-methylbut-2-en-1-yl diphosphate synthase (flavodoxin) n=1 Tax=uncultured Bacillota bacterium TaxID=344338 RepID=A0A650EN28_9FIRM|nr:4-hydroxy-3-methylbut-2-en-1-yl diphosphate synthase (flavodoxin) [uncultured Firmicutes bacterium]
MLAVDRIRGGSMKEQVSVGSVLMGGGAEISIQSMANVPTKETERAVEQINALAQAGCEIVRIAIPDEESAKAVGEIRARTNVPLVADIHFDHRLALMCIERGIDKVRINPGNIGSEENAKAVAVAARRAGIPIRIGVNAGSLEKGILNECGGNLPAAMVASAQRHIDILHKYDFEDIVLSLKASDVKTTIAAYRMAREKFCCPLHLGVTEAGTWKAGLVKSSIGIGALLADGIGDTIRVSLTDDPLKEAEAAKLILSALGLRRGGVEVVSCPTCARCKINLIPIAQQVCEAVEGLNINCKVAVMGCVVNGPGEAKDADIGIAGGDGCAVLFKKGEIVGKIPEEQIVEVLLAELQKMKG